MFLQDYNIPLHLKPQSTSYKVFYDYRINELLEYMMQLFTWHGLPDSIPAHEPDLYLYLYGRAGFNLDKKKELITVVPEMSGCTNYFDIFKNYTWATPLQGGRCYVDFNGVIVSNTMLHNSSLPLIHSTAAKLAHLDTTIICAAINQRDTVAITAINQKFASDASNYQRQKYNGVPNFIVDKGFSTLDFRDLKSSTAGVNIREYADTQQLILTEFWEAIGVSKTVEKRERLITSEADSNKQLLKLNIRNMYNSRLEGVQKINDLFGSNITVECNVDIADEDVTETVPDSMKAGDLNEGMEKENK